MLHFDYGCEMCPFFWQFIKAKVDTLLKGHCSCLGSVPIPSQPQTCISKLVEMSTELVSLVVEAAYSTRHDPHSHL
jgi:hypothetical protein